MIRVRCSSCGWRLGNADTAREAVNLTVAHAHLKHPRQEAVISVVELLLAELASAHRLWWNGRWGNA